MRTAEAWLDERLAKARSGELAGMVRTNIVFEEAAAEWLRYVEHERAVKPGTLEGYRIMVDVLMEDFEGVPIEDFTVESLERWKAAFVKRRNPANRTLQK